MAKYWANWGALPEGATVSIFDVVNTAMKNLYVLAQDEATAMAVARSSGHVRGTHEIHSDYYYRAPHKVDITKDKSLWEFESSIQIAIDQRLQGTLHIENGQILVGREIISPCD